MKNIAYVGALAALLDLDLDVIEAAAERDFAKKPHLVRGQHGGDRISGYDYAKEHFPARCRSASNGWTRPKAT
jgi:2-oxoglutarate/2-oxoacid ferredoxin oxidoreductase subunit alpha